MSELEETSDSGLFRKTAVAVIGGTLTAAGVVMLVTPGPGILAIAGGLGVLSSEFPSAKRTLNRLRRKHPEVDD